MPDLNVSRGNAFPSSSHAVDPLSSSAYAESSSAAAKRAADQAFYAAPYQGVAPLFLNAKVEKLYDKIHEQIANLQAADRSHSTESRLPQVKPLVDDLFSLIELAAGGEAEARHVLNQPEFLQAIQGAGVDLNAIGEIFPLLRECGVLLPTEVTVTIETIKDELAFLRGVKTQTTSIKSRIQKLQEIEQGLRSRDQKRVRRALRDHRALSFEGIDITLQQMRGARTQKQKSLLGTQLVRALVNAAEAGTLLLEGLESASGTSAALVQSLQEGGVALGSLSLIMDIAALTKVYPAFQAFKQDFLANVEAEQQLVLRIQYLEERDTQHKDLPKLRKQLQKQRETNKELAKVLSQQRVKLGFQGARAGGAAITEVFRLASNISSIHKTAVLAQHGAQGLMGAVVVGQGVEQLVNSVGDLRKVHKEADKIEKLLQEYATWNEDQERWVANEPENDGLVIALDLKHTVLLEIATMEHYQEIMDGAFTATRGSNTVLSSTAKILALKSAVLTSFGAIGLALLGGAITARTALYFQTNTTNFKKFFVVKSLRSRLEEVREDLHAQMAEYQKAQQAVSDPDVRQRLAIASQTWKNLKKELPQLEKTFTVEDRRLLREFYGQVADATLGKGWRERGWRQRTTAGRASVFTRERRLPIEGQLDRVQRERFSALLDAVDEAETDSEVDAAQSALYSFLNHLPVGWKVERGDDGSYYQVLKETIDLRGQERKIGLALPAGASQRVKKWMAHQRDLAILEYGASTVSKELPKRDLRILLRRVMPKVKQKMMLENEIRDVDRTTRLAAEAEKLGATTQDLQELRQGIAQTLQSPGRKEAFAAFFKAHPEFGVSEARFNDDPSAAIAFLIGLS